MYYLLTDYVIRDMDELLEIQLNHTVNILNSIAID